MYKYEYTIEKESKETLSQLLVNSQLLHACHFTFNGYYLMLRDLLLVANNGETAGRLVGGRAHKHNKYQ